MIKSKVMLAVFGSQILAGVIVAVLPGAEDYKKRDSRRDAERAEEKENVLFKVFRAFLAIHREGSYFGV